MRLEDIYGYDAILDYEEFEKMKKGPLYMTEDIYLVIRYLYPNLQLEKIYDYYALIVKKNLEKDGKTVERYKLVPLHLYDGNDRDSRIIGQVKIIAIKPKKSSLGTSPDRVLYFDNSENIFKIGVPFATGQKVKIGKLIQEIFDVSDTKSVNAIYNELLKLLSNMEKLKIVDDLVDVYERYTYINNVGTSCICKQNKGQKFYSDVAPALRILSNDPTLKCLVFKHNGLYYAKALVWYGVKYAKIVDYEDLDLDNVRFSTAFLDRIYATNIPELKLSENDIRMMMIAYAKKNGWIRRGIDVLSDVTSVKDCNDNQFHVLLGKKMLIDPEELKEVVSGKYRIYLDTFIGQYVKDDVPTNVICNYCHGKFILKNRNANCPILDENKVKEFLDNI